MLRLEGDYVPTSPADRGKAALDGKIVGLGRSGGEVQLPRVAPHKSGDLRAGSLHRVPSRPSKRVVAARRVAEVLGKERRHRLDDPGVGRGRGVMIHVDRTFQHASSDPWRGRCGQDQFRGYSPDETATATASGSFRENATDDGTGLSSASS